MRLYYEIARRSFRRALVYRSSLLAGLLTNSFFGSIRCFIFIALYRSGAAPAGLTLEEAIAYTWITQVLLSIGGGWVFLDMIQTIRSGDVITDLARPWSFYGYWLSRFAGERYANLLGRGVVTYLIGVLYFRAALPSPAAALAFVLSLFLAVMVSFTINFMVNLVGFWLLDISGLAMIANTIIGLFSGLMVPLVFFPEPLARLARALPFQAITALPAEVFMGRAAGAELAALLALQLLWILALTALALWMLRAAMRKVVIQGG